MKEKIFYSGQAYRKSKNKKGNPVAFIIGDNEFKDQTITLKNLIAKKGENNQITIQKENLIDEVKKLIWKYP